MTKSRSGHTAEDIRLMVEIIRVLDGGTPVRRKRARQLLDKFNDGEISIEDVFNKVFPYSCGYCDKDEDEEGDSQRKVCFEFQSQFLKHFDEKHPFRCDECEERFDSKGDFERDQQKHEEWRRGEPERQARRAQARAQYIKDDPYEFGFARELKKPPIEDIKEFATLGRREAARKHHPDRGGDGARMAQLNHVADWLESLAGAA